MDIDRGSAEFKKDRMQEEETTCSWIEWTLIEVAFGNELLPKLDIDELRKILNSNTN